jgi:hypothetical protein
MAAGQCNQTINKTDPLRKIRPIVNSLKTKFSNSFYPFQDLAIDESLILWLFSFQTIYTDPQN